MATMTLLQVYGPWDGTGAPWSQEARAWSELGVSWDDQAVTWAEALQPWSASLDSSTNRLVNVPAESRIGAVNAEQRILSVSPIS